MTDPTLTVSISGTTDDPDPLVLTGHADPSRYLSISDYSEPAMQTRVSYLTSDDLPDMPLGWTWQTPTLGFNVFYDGMVSEATMRARVATLLSRVARLSYEVTVTVGDADPETWTCQPGSVVPVGGRTLSDLRRFDLLWSVTIPVYPIRSL